MKVLLDAIFINNSGGKVLLDYLIEEIIKREIDVYFLLDLRLQEEYPSIPKEKVTYLPNSLLKRHNFYKKHSGELQKVLCFGNVPPTLRLDAKVFTYFHNSVLFYTGPEFPFKTALAYKVKSWIIRLCQKNTDKWLVQTEFMKSGLSKYWGISPYSVDLFPFFSTQIIPQQEIKRDKYSYYYISDGHPNKMHHHLLNAFAIASSTCSNIKLHLTVSKQYPELIQTIEDFNKKGIAIENMGWCGKEKLKEIYQKGGFLIFPSSLESFGLGLIEAAQYGMPILASDLPFVHEVIRPSLTFDPHSVQSITDAIVKSQKEEVLRTELIVSSKVEDLIHLLK